MIRGIGVDLVRIERMREALQRFGERFSRRILTHDELEDFRRCPQPARFLASRFAAKEACAKALGTGFRAGLSLRHIGVTHDPSGKPLLTSSDKASLLLRERGITATHVSLSDEQAHAIAFVILESGTP